MHVPGADLQAVCVLLDHGEIARVHDFSNHGQARLRARFGEKAKSLFAQPLKTVWGSPRFKRAAAQNFCARFFHDRRDRLNLFSTFNRARTANKDNILVFAQAHVANCHTGGAARVARGKFVWLQHRDDCFHARHRGNRLFAKERLRPNYADDHARCATTDLCLEPELAYASDDPLDLFLSGVWLRDDDHILAAGSSECRGQKFSASPDTSKKAGNRVDVRLPARHLTAIRQDNERPGPAKS